MKKKSEGIVVELNGEYAVVMPTAHLGCDALYCCQGEGVSKVNVEMINTVCAIQGDKIIFVAQENNMLKAAFVVYMLPLILVFIGVASGYSVAPMLGIYPALGSIIGGIVFFLIAAVIIKFYDRYASGNRGMKPEIICVVK